MGLTKIIATVGPASCSTSVLRAIIEEGVDVIRLNFSHGSHDDHEKMYKKVRDVASQTGKYIGIMQDISGPKIRIGEIKTSPLILDEGDELIMTCDENADGSGNRVFVSCPGFSNEVKKGDRIFLADGLLEVEVKDSSNGEVKAEVIDGGELTSKKGVNLPMTKLSLPSLTEKDKIDVEFGLRLGVDMMALSFVRDPKDIEQFRDFMKKSGRIVPIIAKIEKPEAIEKIDAIIEIADGVMIARGDLAIEIPLQKVPAIQKEIIKKARRAHRPVIVATQMLESMIVEERPTRAEVTDVASAVFDGAGAVMLSGETAIGKHPQKVVKLMEDIISEAEKTAYSPTGDLAIYNDFNVEFSVATSAVTMANTLNAKAVFALTLSGRSAELLSCQRPSLPIIAFSPSDDTLKKLSLYFGVYPVGVVFHDRFSDILKECVRRAKEENFVRSGDYVIVTAGYPFEEKVQTNLVHALMIP